jgi:hypothetical protein
VPTFAYFSSAFAEKLAELSEVLAKLKEVSEGVSVSACKS